MAGQFLNPNPTFLDETTFQPVRSGWLKFCENKTNLVKPVYLESVEQTIANGADGRIRLDGNGRIPEMLFFSGFATVELQRADGTQVWRRDNVEAAGGGGGGVGAGGVFVEFRYQRSVGQPNTPTGDNPTGWATSPPSVGSDPIWVTQGRKLITTGGLVDSWSTPVQLTGDPGNAGVLLVEYSVNGVNGWHEPPFAVGDMFMRQSLGQGFGPAIRIVGENGDDGPYVSFVFQRAATQPVTPPGNDPTPVGWSDAPPTDNITLPLWFTRARLSADGQTVLIPWSAPVNARGNDGLNGDPGTPLIVQYSPNGVDSWHDAPPNANDYYLRQKLGDAGSYGPSTLFRGENGDNGPYTSLIFRRAATAPATPAGNDPNPSGWFDGPPAGTELLWLSTALKVDANTLLTAWSTPQQISGPPGDNGDPGVDGDTPVILFRQLSVQPSTPTGNNPAGWSEAPPSNPTTIIWFTRNTKNSAGDVLGPWSIPVQFTGNSVFVQYSANQTGPWHNPPFVAGSDRYQRQRMGAGAWSVGYLIVGENGSDGEFTDYRFLRTVSAQPATPTGNNPSGWFDSPPTGTGVLWMSKARKTAQGNLIGSWSVPVRLNGEDGRDGTNGTNGTNGATGGTLQVLTDRIGINGSTGSVTINAVAGRAIIIKIQGSLVGFSNTQPPGTATLRIRRGATTIAEVTVSIAYSSEPGFGGIWNGTGGAVLLVADDPTPSAGSRTYTSQWTGGAAQWAADITSPLMSVEQVQ